MYIIDNYEDPRLDVYARLSEPQLRTIYEPDMGLFIAESPMVIERALDAGYEPESVLTCMEAKTGHGRKIIERIERDFKDVPVYVGTDEALKPIRGYQLTRGVLCAMRRRAAQDMGKILKIANRIVLLYDVENPGNVGAIIRSAAAMFMDAVLLTPDCADPLYRRAARVSVGTVFGIPWAYPPECGAEDGGDRCIELLRSNGFRIAAMALVDDSVSISDDVLKGEEKLAIVMGNEGYGLPRKIMDESDFAVKIPMAEGVDSLNVAAAAAVAFWELRSR